MRHVSSVVAFFGVAIVALPQITWGDVFTISDLGSRTSRARAFGISSTGLIVGNFGPSGSEQPFIYSNGSLNALTLTNGFPFGYGYAVNASGQVTGEALAGSSEYPGHAFIYTNGHAIDIGVPGSIGSYGSAINDAGQVAGSFLSADQTWHAYLYSNGQTTDIGTLGGSRSEARAINDNGVVAGSAALTGDSAVDVYLYSNRSMQDLGFSGTVQGINASSQLTGWMEDSSGNSHAFFYSDGIARDLGALGGEYSFGYGINDSGDVVGEILLPDNRTFHAFLYSNGVMTDLNDLIDPNAGWVLDSAKGINDAGQIVGYGTFNRQTSAFELTPSTSPSGTTPTPEPATAAALLLAAPLLLRRWRRSA